MQEGRSLLSLSPHLKLYSYCILWLYRVLVIISVIWLLYVLGLFCWKKNNFGHEEYFSVSTKWSNKHVPRQYCHLQRTYLTYMNTEKEKYELFLKYVNCDFHDNQMTRQQRILAIYSWFIFVLQNSLKKLFTKYNKLQVFYKI